MYCAGSVTNILRKCLPAITPNQLLPLRTLFILCVTFFGYWQKHSAILEELYSAGQIEVLYQSHIKHLKQFFQSQKADPIEKEPYDYWAGIRCGILLGIFIPWIRKQKKESVEELVAILRHQMEEISRQKLFF